MYRTYLAELPFDDYGPLVIKLDRDIPLTPVLMRADDRIFTPTGFHSNPEMTPTIALMLVASKYYNTKRARRKLQHWVPFNPLDITDGYPDDYDS